ncbi:MAG: glycoside hydrolase family 3 N-terminal domain-containing protein [Ktedonobacterales bacterium]
MLASLLTTLLIVVVAVPLLYVFAPTGEPLTALLPNLPYVGAAPARTPTANAVALATQLRRKAELAYVNNLIAHMSLDEEIGQMIMIGFNETQMDPALAYQIEQDHVGSAILYAFNIKGGDKGAQVQQLDQAMQAQAKIPLMIATDQEGGGVNRLLGVDGPLPSASQIGATNDPHYATQRGQQDAQALTSLGINVNLAPVVDVMNTTGGDLGGRTFGSTPGEVTKMAGAYLQGLQQSGQVVGALKHFPGLGDVPVDPHQQLYNLNRSLPDLQNIDWAPYKSLIATGQVQMVMSTHVVLTAVDATRPASLSYPVLTGILRQQLGFDGVIVTDGIYMKALSEHYSFDQIILYAIEAGNDIICSTYSIQSTDEAIAVLRNAVESGQLPRSRIDDSVRRILLVKLHLGLLALPK